ncbi:hypothetical protein NDU88_004257 [Pleurodeles waltl]|uniref:Uncharacterized protein n=1 Tax=Pleurodeles waltl TaxID=8319 RepID=A0AAV7NRZ8_PLEWA|nr:hypothetical protein NDU88_004257 [Pleurodeles waltl]
MAARPDHEAVRAVLITLGAAQRGNLLRPRVRQEAWVGMERQTQAAARGMAVAVVAYSSPKGRSGCKDVLELDYDVESEEWEEDKVCEDDGVGQKQMAWSGGDSQETGVCVLRESSVDVGSIQGRRKLIAPFNRCHKKDLGMPSDMKDWWVVSDEKGGVHRPRYANL